MTASLMICETVVAPMRKENAKLLNDCPVDKNLKKATAVRAKWLRDKFRITLASIPTPKSGDGQLCDYNGEWRLPETGEDVSPDLIPETDPLANVKNLTTEQCISAIAQQSSRFESGIHKIEKRIEEAEEKNDLFAEVLDSIEKLSEPLDSTWGLLKTLYMTNEKLVPAKYYKNIHERARKARSLKYNSVQIHKACKNFIGQEKTDEQKRIVFKYLLEGRLNGLELSDNDQIIWKSVLQKHFVAKNTYREKLEISQGRFKQQLRDPAVTHDFPDDLLRSIAADKSQPSRGPWTVTLKPNVYAPFLEYCPDRDLRWNVWQANVRSCSLNDDRSLENSTVIQDLRKLRRRMANIVGYKTYVDMSMETKMAGSIENVKSVMEQLLSKARISQEEELLKLEKFAVERKFKGPLQAWDIPYWKRKQLRSEYGLDEEVLKDYFPFPKVLSGLFNIIEKLYGIQIVEQENENKWHPDIGFYHILESGATQPIASFYIDPYRREGEKLGGFGGFAVPISNRSVVANTKPLTTFIFNFQAPMYGKPSLLSFNEVHILFQKFGQGLQQLLSKTTYSEVSGLSNVEWDAAEICSNVMTHWLYESKVLESLSGHHVTGEALPKLFLDRLSQLRHCMAGYDLCHELYLASLDLELHSSTEFWGDVMKHLWTKHFVLLPDDKDSHPCSFADIFSGEWAAAYYSHLWSRMIAADVFSAFQEAGLDNAEECRIVGERFKSTYLALGGACHPSEVFRRFRGRDPSPKALLKQLGLKSDKPISVQ